MRLVILMSAMLATTRAVWNATNLPDPTRLDKLYGFEKCRMKAPSLLCDPDGALKEGERDALNRQLLHFQNATADPGADSYCKRKGTTAMIAIFDELEIGMMNQHNMSMLAVQLHNRWRPDEACRKSFVIVLPKRNWRLISRDYHYEAPIFYDEFTFYFFREHEAFGNRDYFTALTNIIAGLQNAVNLKRQLIENEFIAALNDLSYYRATGALPAFAAFGGQRGILSTALAYLRNFGFVFAVAVISLISFALFELISAGIAWVWPKWTKTYHPIEKEKDNGIAQNSPISDHTSPISHRSSKNNLSVVYGNRNQDGTDGTIKFTSHADTVVRASDHNNNNSNNNIVDHRLSTFGTVAPSTGPLQDPLTGTNRGSGYGNCNGGDIQV